MLQTVTLFLSLRIPKELEPQKENSIFVYFSKMIRPRVLMIAAFDGVCKNACLILSLSVIVAEIFNFRF
jgi:hypothetical protein